MKIALQKKSPFLYNYQAMTAVLAYGGEDDKSPEGSGSSSSGANSESDSSQVQGSVGFLNNNLGVTGTINLPGSRHTITVERNVATTVEIKEGTNGDPDSVLTTTSVVAAGLKTTYQSAIAIEGGGESNKYAPAHQSAFYEH